MNDPLLTDDNKKTWNEYVRYIPFIGEKLEKSDKVAVLRMGGVIADSAMMRRAGISAKKFDEAIEAAFKASNLKAVALVINSPGGAPAQCSLISSKIRKLSEEKEVPVFAFVEDVAASGGYWLSCIGDEIYAQESSIVGSIGVISSGFGLDEFIKRYDVSRRIHTSGRDKSFLDPFKPEKPEDVSRLKSLQENIHQSFKDWVHERRGSRLNGRDEDLMEGAFWTGKDALEHGLIDGIGDVYGIMRQRYGEKIRLVDYSPEKKSLLSSLLPFGGGEAALDMGAIIEVAEERAAWNRFGL